MALAVEKPSRINQQAGGVDVAQHDAVLFDLQAFLGVHRSFHLSRNADDARLDIAFHLALVVDHHGAVGDDFTLKWAFSRMSPLATFIFPSNSTPGSSQPTQSSGKSDNSRRRVAGLLKPNAISTSSEQRLAKGSV